MSIIRRTEGTPLQVLRDSLLLKLPSSQSPNGMTVMTVTVAPGGAVPPHRHGHAEEGYFVLAGTLHLTVDKDEHALAAGDFAHVPPGSVHCYRNCGAEPVEFLAWTIGGQLDHFFKDIHLTIKEMPLNLPLLHEITARHDVEMVFPD